MAFARHYWGTVNRTAVAPKSGDLERLATNGCKTCKNFESAVRTNVESGWRFSDAEGKVSDAEWRHNRVWMKIDPIDASLVNRKTGALVKDYPKEAPYIWVFSLKWTSEGWRVASMKVADRTLW